MNRHSPSAPAKPSTRTDPEAPAVFHAAATPLMAAFAALVKSADPAGAKATDAVDAVGRSVAAAHAMSGGLHVSGAGTAVAGD